MDDKAMFADRIAEPLESVVGRTLLDVNYWILEFEAANFRAAQPNDTGIAVVSLRFEASGVEIAPGWENALRPSGIQYHIQVFHSDNAGGMESADAGNLCKVAAIQSAPWREAVGKPLTGVQVLGLRGSPQAIQLSFPGATLVVATGYPGDNLEVGDHDELLVFSEQEWHSLTRSHEQVWERLWGASATRSSELLVP